MSVAQVLRTIYNSFHFTPAHFLDTGRAFINFNKRTIND